MKPHVALLFAVTVLLAGCSVKSAGKAAVSTITFTGSVATKTTVAAVKTSGQIVSSTTKAVVKTTGHVVATVVKVPMITFKDTVTGVTKQIPYSEGLRLYAASETAKFQMGLKAFQLVRNGTPVLTSTWAKVKAGTNNDPVLHAGDVIQVSSTAKTKAIAKRS